MKRVPENGKSGTYPNERVPENGKSGTYPNECVPENNKSGIYDGVKEEQLDVLKIKHKYGKLIN